MDNYALFTKSISLSEIGIENATIHYQLSANELHERTVSKNQGKDKFSHGYDSLQNTEMTFQN